MGHFNVGDNINKGEGVRIFNFSEYIVYDVNQPMNVA